MKLIIDIPEEEYEKNKSAKCDYHTLRMAIKNGIPLEEELEKVRDKIIKKANSGQWSEPTIYGMQKAVFIIDNELSELKGENNPDCRNCDKWKTCENGEKGHANGTSIGYSIGECGDYVELKGENK